ncbi:MAG: hypothetical protein ACR2QM_06300 [Longimicrobiales bacterium]
MNQRSKTAARIAAEFSVIVVGVLVALAVDGWVQALDDSRLEREYLVRLEADLVLDSANIAAARIESGRAHEGLMHFRSLWEARATLDADSIVTTYLGARTVGGEPVAAKSTFEELKATGNLRLLTSTSVREAVLDYHFFADEQRARLLTSRERGRERYWEAFWETGIMMGPGAQPTAEEMLGRLASVPDMESLVIRAMSYHANRSTLWLPQWGERIANTLAAVREDHSR